MVRKIKTKRIYDVYSDLDDTLLGSIAVQMGHQKPADTEDVKFLYAGSE